MELKWDKIKVNNIRIEMTILRMSKLNLCFFILFYFIVKLLAF